MLVIISQRHYTNNFILLTAAAKSSVDVSEQDNQGRNTGIIGGRRSFMAVQ